MPADASLLMDLPLFASLKPLEREALAGVVDHHRLAAGASIFKAGDPGQAMYVVSRGEVEISVTDHAGQKIVLTVARKGDVFGELSMLDAGPRSASAQALTEVELLELDREDLLMLFARQPEAALHMLGAMGAMTRKADLLLRRRVSRNATHEVQEHLTLVERVADWIAAFSGSMKFLALNALWFGTWIFINTAGIAHFDPYPFGLLTMIVSLQAIFLSIFVLLAQNRQAAKDHVRDDIEYEINVKAELEVAHLHERLDEIRANLFDRLERIEGALAARRPPGP